MIKNVVDTHRLMYRNARIRAFDLSDRTTAIPFYNVTDQILPDENIGYEVRTDAAGYVYYGVNAQPVQCLAVAKSAIIQVDLTGSGAWDIEWVLRTENEDEFLKVVDIHKVFYADGSLAWNPLLEDWQLPDYALKSDVANGEWAEGEMVVTEDTPFDLNIDKWTHVVTFRNGHSGEYRLPYVRGRYGQTIRMLNISSTDVVVITQHIVNGHIYNIRVRIRSDYQCEATYTNSVGWYMMEPRAYTDSDYIITEVPPIGVVTINLDENPNVRRVIYRPAATAVKTIAFMTSGTAATVPFIEVVNETAFSVQTQWRYQTSPGIYGPATTTEVVPTRSTLMIAPAACNGARSRIITYNTTYIENSNVHVTKTPEFWWGTIRLTTDLLGIWLPIRVYSSESISLPGDQTATLAVYVNDILVYETDLSANMIKHQSTHDPVFVGAGTLLMAFDVRIVKLTIEGETRWAADVNLLGDSHEEAIQ